MRSGVRVLLLVAVASCVRPVASFVCGSSDQCTGGGVCQPVGFCSFSDTTCATGQRYGTASGALAGVCVGAETDAPPGCDLAKPFGSPALVDGVGSAAEDGSLRLSPDEKAGYFFSARTGTKLLYTASRTSAIAAFSGVTVLANVNTGDQYNPAITADGSNLFFASLRTSGIGDNDIYQATRSGTSDFTNIRLAPTVNTILSEVQPYVTHDGGTMYFVRKLLPGITGSTVFRATGSVTAGFSNANPVAELDGPTNDTDPVLSADGLTLYWGTDRAGGQGDIDVWQAQRETITAAFHGLAPVASVNTASFDSPSDISEDGCRLYLTSLRSGKPAIYVATRPP